MSLHNIAEYKKALVFVKDLEKILKVLRATEVSLKSHKQYSPVQAVLTTISEAKPIVEIYLAQYKIIVETKGERRF